MARPSPRWRRVALGGAQSLYAQRIPGFAPDMSVFGKVIGGGMPLAAFGGKRAVMQHLAPVGGVYQAGTLSGNPIATACGLATLREISRPGFFEALSQRTRQLVDGLAGVALWAFLSFGLPKVLELHDRGVATAARTQARSACISETRYQLQKLRADQYRRSGEPGDGADGPGDRLHQPGPADLRPAHQKCQPR